MSQRDGYIELDRAVASIQVGTRHRTELGDIATLAASIKRDGLLQPITVTPDAVLVCGARRLAAIKQLGWYNVKVWVRSGISGRLAHLLAEQDDNVLHKPLTQLENAALYREIKTLMAEDAARRQEASRFSVENQPGTHGAAKCAAPSESLGDARAQAAAMIPGGVSHTTLEKITFLQQLLADESQPEPVRQHVAAELEHIGAGAPVHPAYQRVRQLAATAEPNLFTQDIAQLAEEALARIKSQPDKKRRLVPGTRQTRPDDDEPWPVRSFVHTWNELNGWWNHFDATILANQLTKDQAAVFFTAADGTARFAEQLRTAIDDTTADQDTTQARRLHAI